MGHSSAHHTSFTVAVLQHHDKTHLLSKLFHLSANCNTFGAPSPPFPPMPQVCVQQHAVLIRNWGSQRGRSCQHSAQKCFQGHLSTVMLTAHAASMPVCSSSPHSLFSFTRRKPAARALPFREFSGRTRAEVAPACCSCTKASPATQELSTSTKTWDPPFLILMG